MYDADTLSVIGPLDVFGLPSGSGSTPAHHAPTHQTSSPTGGRRPSDSAIEAGGGASPSPSPPPSAPPPGPLPDYLLDPEWVPPPPPPPPPSEDWREFVHPSPLWVAEVTDGATPPPRLSSPQPGATAGEAAGGVRGSSTGGAVVGPGGESRISSPRSGLYRSASPTSSRLLGAGAGGGSRQAGRRGSKAETAGEGEGGSEGLSPRGAGRGRASGGGAGLASQDRQTGASIMIEALTQVRLEKKKKLTQVWFENPCEFHLAPDS